MSHLSVRRKELQGTKKEPVVTDPMAEPKYTKLYKEFGANNKNKDVRKQLAHAVESDTDKKMSTGF